MVSSLDGYIAKKDNSISWFETSSQYDKGIKISDQEKSAFLKTIDCYVMGSRTYEHAIELSKSYGWGYGDVPTIVVTKRKLTIDRPTIEIYAKDFQTLVDKHLKPKYKNVWVVGGAALVKDFLRLKLVDEIRLPVLPIILGDGIPFFDHVGVEQLLQLKDVAAYRNGMVELCYRIKKD